MQVFQHSMQASLRVLAVARILTVSAGDVFAAAFLCGYQKVYLGFDLALPFDLLLLIANRVFYFGGIA